MRSTVIVPLIKAAQGAVIASDVNNLTKVKVTNDKIKQPMRRMTTKITKQLVMWSNSLPTKKTTE